MISVTSRIAHSPFLSAAIVRQPGVADAIRKDDFEGALVAVQHAGEGEPPRRALRLQREALALAIAAGDLAGAFPLERVVALLSNFADQALSKALGAAVDARVPGAVADGLVAIALGKHGSRELNYSSDIDPIILFDAERLPRRERDDPGEAAVRYTRAVVDMLQARDADGYVLRVDLRLRPASEATPLALPVAAAIGHYESSALPWERVAFVRARAAAGDLALGQSFLAAIQPFVWRRALDFGAIEDLRALSAQIRDHYADRQQLGPGYDLKRGRGGIRELEFFVQAHQLIHGGRDPALRVAAILDALPALAKAGHVEAETAASLGAAYRTLRTIEHRLQMMEDRQTHRLPMEPSELDAVARLHGLAGGGALVALLAPHIEAVATVFDSLAPASSAPMSARTSEQAIKGGHFLDAEALAARLARWRGGQLRALRTPVALAAFERVVPSLLAAFDRAPDPDQAVARFDAMLERLPTALNLFRLLEARPGLLDTLVTILAHAPVLADALAQSPALLDGLLDATALDPAPDVATLIAAMQAAGDLESRLDRVRLLVGEYRFALGTQLVLGLSDPLDVAAGYARVAEAAVSVVADAIVGTFVAVHGRVPNSELLILALGRLGGRALTHASDLDLIYLFTGDFERESDGPKPLGSTLYYNRLAQRLTSGLSTYTSAGKLYEVDTRLRPSGAQGPLVVSLDSFRRYQHESAWTWEHMALTRARCVYGSTEARAAVEGVVASVFAVPRDAAKIRNDARSMREDMARHKPPAGPLDVKLQPGGLVDLEFAVQTLQLVHRVAVDPDLAVSIAALVDAGLLEVEAAAAHALLTRLLVIERLVAPNLTEIAPATRALVVRACGAHDWNDLLAQLERARQCVTRCRDRAFGLRSGET